MFFYTGGIALWGDSNVVFRGSKFVFLPRVCGIVWAPRGARF